MIDRYHAMLLATPMYSFGGEKGRKQLILMGGCDQWPYSYISGYVFVFHRCRLSIEKYGTTRGRTTSSANDGLVFFEGTRLVLHEASIDSVRQEDRD